MQWIEQGKDADVDTTINDKQQNAGKICKLVMIITKTKNIEFQSE